MGLFKTNKIDKFGKEFKKKSKDLTKYINKNIKKNNKIVYYNNVDNCNKLLIYLEDDSKELKEYAAYCYAFNDQKNDVKYLNNYISKCLESKEKEIFEFLKIMHEYSISLNYNDNIILSSKNM